MLAKTSLWIPCTVILVCYLVGFLAFQEAWTCRWMNKFLFREEDEGRSLLPAPFLKAIKLFLRLEAVVVALFCLGMAAIFINAIIRK